MKKLRILNTPHWYCYVNTDLYLDHKAGKMIAYIRCEDYTTEEERIVFFHYLAQLLENYSQCPVSGKIGKRVNQNNLCAFLFYCNECDKDKLKTSLIHIKTLLDIKYQHWFNKKPLKILTWNWRWKSNEQTIAEINNGTHWTYQAGLREKIS